jgi:hypothetical protein
VAQQTSVSIGGAQATFTYNAGNGRATSVEVVTPIRVRYVFTLTDGTVIDRTLEPGSYSFPLPANKVRVTIDGQGEVTMSGLSSIAADTFG